MIHNEQTTEIKNIYKGKIIDLNVHSVILPNNNTAIREIVSHPGAVAILPIDDEGKIIFVKQFRKAVEEELLEIPAGKLEKGEEPKACAIRELEEETGFIPSCLEYMAKIYTSPGFSNEEITIYIAKNLIPGSVHYDEDEFIELYRYTFEESVELIKKGVIKDGKTIAAISLFKNY